MLRLGILGILALVVFAPLCARGTQTIQRGDYSFDLGDTPNWVDKRALPTAWDSTAPGMSGERWRYWLLDIQSDRRKGKRARYYDQAYEPISSELTGEAAKFDVGFFPDFQRLTVYEVALRRGGVWQDRLDPKRVTLARRESSFERDMTTGAVTALMVLDDVRPGDVVRIRYGIDGENPILAGLDDERATFAAASVILDRHMRVLADTDAKLAVRSLNGAPKPSEKTGHDFRELEWSAHGIAAIHDEGAYPIWYWVAPQVVVTEDRTWADVAAWARALYPPYKALPPDLEQQISKWKSLGKIDERISAALRAVQEEVRYFGTEIGDNSHRPAEPADTWNHRYGDCKDKARLLAAILDRLGIQAHPALVSASHGRGVADLPPAASAFDHVIVQVELSSEVIWLDATATQQRGPLRGLDRSDFGMALPVSAGTRDLVRVPPPTAVDGVHEHERYAAGVDGKVTLQVETRFSGFAAEQMRRSLQTQGKEEINRHYADYYRKRYGDIVVKQPVEIRQNDAENSVTVNEVYDLSNAWTSSTPASHVMETYADLIGSRVSLPKTMERTTPLAISHPSDIEQTVEVALPKGWRWHGQGDSKTIDDAFIHYEKNVRESDNVVHISQHYTSREDAADVTAANKHLQQLRGLNDMLGQRMVFSVPEQDAEKQRRQRLENVMRNIMDQKGDTKNDKPDD